MPRPRMQRTDSLKLRKQGKVKILAERNLVYVRDETYAWLPAKIISESVGNKVKVSIDLPPDWRDKTVQYSVGFNYEEREIDLRDYPGKELPIQNLYDEEGDKAAAAAGTGDCSGKADMGDLYFLHDAAILYNLRDRHYNGFPYTRVGDIMIAVNPFQWIDGLYSVENQKFYAKKLIWEEAQKGVTFQESADAKSICSTITEYSEYKPLSHPPHIYETASLAYKGLAIDGEDQTILVTGESGAGKTETVKLVMSYLAALQSTHPDFRKTLKSSKSLNQNIDNTIIARILQSNPIFEAFGNAKTIRNSNSSRFGKFTRLQFSVDDDTGENHNAPQKVPNCRLIGSKFQTYLLEKSRVVNLDKGERLYHIFYQLIAASEAEKASIWHGLQNSKTTNFKYFDKSSLEIIDGTSDAQNWSTTVKALDTIGIKGEIFLSLMRSLCLVLQFGNLAFAPDPSAPETGSVIANLDELNKVSELIGVPADLLSTALTQRNVKASWEDINFALSPADAKDGCDALAKEIYSILFDFVVEAIDKATGLNIEDGNDGTSQSVSNNTTASSHGNETMGVISLLDIFGFECFKVNRFEQLCINYANERLQQKYVSDVFHAIQTEYEEEGIEVFDFKSIDNMDVLELIEGRKYGILTILNEECVLPRGNDSSFAFKVKKVNDHSLSLIKNNLFAPYEFAIAHFSGPVKYDARKFVERNKDSLPSDVIHIALNSTNTFIAKEFAKKEKQLEQQQVTSRIKSRKGKGSTVVSKFKAQLTSLVKDIEPTRTRYIRCIKPNADKEPRVTDNVMTMNQLSSAGIATAITIWRETFPKHMLYDQFLERFRCLAVIDMKDATDAKGKSSLLLSILFDGQYRVVGGQVIKPFACGKTKVFFRSGSLEILSRARSKLFAQSSILVQTLLRGIAARTRYHALRAGAIKLQNYWRAKLTRRDFLLLRSLIIFIQSCVRMLFAKVKARKLRRIKSALIIQKSWRASKDRKLFFKFKDAARVIQRAIRHKKDMKNLISSLASIRSQGLQNVIHEEKSSSFEIPTLKQMTTGKQRQKESDIREFSNQESRRKESDFHEYSNQVSVLRSEIASIRSELEDQRKVQRMLRIQNENMRANSESSKAEIHLLNQKISRLTRECEFRKEENVTLRNMVKNMQHSHTKQIRQHIDAFNHREEQKQKEIEGLEREFLELKKSHYKEMKAVNHELDKSKVSQNEDVSALKNEIERILEGHKADLVRMYNVLGVTQSSDLLVQSIDNYMKLAYEEKVESLKAEIDSYQRLMVSVDAPPKEV